MNGPGWIVPDWPAPACVQAVTTTRCGGVSSGPWRSMNPADHVEDATAHVQANRALLAERLALPAAPVWLRQVHGTRIVDAASVQEQPAADGSWTGRAGVVCAVLTADCLPVLLCDRQGRHVAAVHAGWRGLADGVIEAAVAALPVPGDALLAWLGPAIGPRAFAVGEEVEAAFTARDPRAADAFRRDASGQRYADLYRLARQRLAGAGIEAVHGGNGCTFSEPERFFSYRRDGVTGRMATLIWLAGG